MIFIYLLLIILASQLFLQIWFRNSGSLVLYKISITISFLLCLVILAQAFHLAFIEHKRVSAVLVCLAVVLHTFSIKNDLRRIRKPKIFPGNLYTVGQKLHLWEQPWTYKNGTFRNFKMIIEDMDIRTPFMVLETKQEEDCHFWVKVVQGSKIGWFYLESWKEHSLVQPWANTL